MANVKITELTALTNPASSDVLPIVDVGADETKKVTIADLLENAGSGTASAAAFAFDGDADTGMYRTGANSLGFTTGGTGRLFISDSGRVGVGTSGPVKNFDIYGDSGLIVRSTNRNATETPIFIGGSNVNERKLALIGKPAGSYGRQDLLICSNDVQDATDVTSANAVVTIKSSGNVGIGTTSPAVACDVVGQVRASTGILFGSDTAAANALDDYEEGTFTPTITQGVTSPTYGTSNTGVYRIIGKQLFFSLRVQLTGGTTDSNALEVGGLPGYISSGSVYLYPQTGKFQSGANNTTVVAVGQSSTDYLTVYDSSDRTAVTGTEATNTLDLQITGSYPLS